MRRRVVDYWAAVDDGLGARVAAELVQRAPANGRTGAPGP
jgi:hypothetical protein